MIEPKDFYRKMDALLARIGKGSENKHYLPSIMKALEATFGADLHIGNGRIYMEDGSTFLLVDRSGNARLGRRILADLEAVQQVLTHGSYIYDDPGATAFRDAGDVHAVPAAFAVVPGLNRRWIFAYDLQNGWIREEVQLCMNAVRAALNYRLSLENIKSGLEQAAEIQRSLLPTRAPQVEGFEIAERSQPAEIVGGDLFDYLPFGEEILGVSIGDASGHGLPAALLVRDVVTGLRMGMEEEMKMVYTFRKLNRVIHRSMLSSRFVSLFYSEVERNGNLLYVKRRPSAAAARPRHGRPGASADRHDPRRLVRSSAAPRPCLTWIPGPFWCFIATASSSGETGRKSSSGSTGSRG